MDPGTPIRISLGLPQHFARHRRGVPFAERQELQQIHDRVAFGPPEVRVRDLVRQDAKFAIQKRTGAHTRFAVAWRPVPAMKEPKGVKTTNTLMIRARGNTVRFFIGDKEVARLTRAQVGGDGITGLRINHNLHVQVSKFAVKKLP